MMLCDFSSLCSALEYLAGDIGTRIRDERLTIPKEWEKRFKLAEEAASELDEEPLESFLDVDDDETDGQDNALETMAVGDASLRDELITMVKGGKELDEVLESAFEGELYRILFEEVPRAFAAKG